MLSASDKLQKERGKPSLRNERLEQPLFVAAFQWNTGLANPLLEGVQIWRADLNPERSPKNALRVRFCGQSGTPKVAQGVSSWFPVPSRKEYPAPPHGTLFHLKKSIFLGVDSNHSFQPSFFSKTGSVSLGFWMVS